MVPIDNNFTVSIFQYHNRNVKCRLHVDKIPNITQYWTKENVPHPDVLRLQASTNLAECDSSYSRN